jgi:hypothetical protein
MDYLFGLVWSERVRAAQRQCHLAGGERVTVRVARPADAEMLQLVPRLYAHVREQIENRTINTIQI